MSLCAAACLFLIFRRSTTTSLTKTRRLTLHKLVSTNALAPPVTLHCCPTSAIPTSSNHSTLPTQAPCSVAAFRNGDPVSRLVPQYRSPTFLSLLASPHLLPTPLNALLAQRLTGQCNGQMVRAELLIHQYGVGDSNDDGFLAIYPSLLPMGTALDAIPPRTTAARSSYPTRHSRWLCRTRGGAEMSCHPESGRSGQGGAWTSRSTPLIGPG